MVVQDVVHHGLANTTDLKIHYIFRSVIFAFFKPPFSDMVVCLQLVSLVRIFNWCMVVACGFLLGWFCLLVNVVSVMDYFLYLIVSLIR